MGEDPVKKQLNTAKRSACVILKKAGYTVERASNDIYCIVAMRGAEWRTIKVGLDSIIKCPWFIKEIKRLERLPCPDRIKKEVWVRVGREHNFKLYFYEHVQWFDESYNPTRDFDN